MCTIVFKVFGLEGHRQRESFGDSYHWDFSEGDNFRIIDVQNADKTGTNDYSLVSITCNSFEECLAEINGQITDGIFENSRVGKVEEVERRSFMR